MAYTQEDRLIAIETPLGKDALLLAGFRGTEGISSLFHFDLDILSENHSVVFEDIIGKTVTVSMIMTDGSPRSINGIISSFCQERGSGDSGTNPDLFFYTATMVPWFWLLTRSANSRIFQKLSVPDIVEKIFEEKGFLDYKLSLHAGYEERDYCVQYRETDFNFISRLLEDEGICYFFKHEKGKHTLVLAGVESKQALAPQELEIYDYPGEYDNRALGETRSNLRMQEEEAKITTISGSSNCRAFTSGYRFDLDGYYRDDMNNKAFVLTYIDHVASVADSYVTGAGRSEFAYSNNFTCTPFDVPYRPPRITPKPVVQGTQTAIVTGPAGETIYPDKYGRVKIKFHWDRENNNDDKSSCWVRVSQAWAGQGWGSMHIPHVGQEVIVDFFEGDPDRPHITGRLYHANNMAADALPGEKTKSVFRDHGGNEQIIEGKDGDKHIVFKQACGNEIRMHESTPDIEIKQECGNEVLMKASGPDIEVKQACGNEIFMKASGPDIEIKQACGNEILMHEADGIQMRDKYGNEVVLDAASGFIRIASPTHNSNIEIGKSLKFTTDSKSEHLISADASFTCLGATNNLFVGAKGSEHIGLSWDVFGGGKMSNMLSWSKTWGYGREWKKNFADRDKKIDGHYYMDSEKHIELIGGSGDQSQIRLDQGSATMKSVQGAFIEIQKNGKILINNKKSGGQIEIFSNEQIVINSGEAIEIYAPEIRAKKGTFETKNIKDLG